MCSWIPTRRLFFSVRKIFPIPQLQTLILKIFSSVVPDDSRAALRDSDGSFASDLPFRHRSFAEKTRPSAAIVTRVRAYWKVYRCIRSRIRRHPLNRSQSANKRRRRRGYTPCYSGNIPPTMICQSTEGTDSGIFVCDFSALIEEANRHCSVRSGKAWACCSPPPLRLAGPPFSQVLDRRASSLISPFWSPRPTGEQPILLDSHVRTSRELQPTLSDIVAHAFAPQPPGSNRNMLFRSTRGAFLDMTFEDVSFFPLPTLLVSLAEQTRSSTRHAKLVPETQVDQM